MRQPGQAEVAAHNMVSAPAGRWPYLATPVFWSAQFGTNIKSVGVPAFVRNESPVHMLPYRAMLADIDIDIAGPTIPDGSVVSLMLAAGSRDPRRFPDPDRFAPDRTDNQHLGYGGGIHYCFGAPLDCFGAPLARVETQVALPELARRLVNPRLVTDPPP
jgi:cytochrome P450